MEILDAVENVLVAFAFVGVFAIFFVAGFLTCKFFF